MGYRFVLRETAETPYGSVDIDVIEELADEIATLSAHIHAATHRLLVLIARFDALRGWEGGGFVNCAAWLAFRTGIDMGAAREKVRAARALANLPLTSAAMARGQLSFSQVRALTRIADAENEEELLALANGATAAQVERVVRGWKRGSRQDEAGLERERHASRCLSVFPDDDGMYVVKGRLTPELGALLQRAIEAASDALYREGGGGAADTADSDREAAQRRADALGLLAERAMAAGFGANGPLSGTKAERYQVMLHVDASTLDPASEPGRSDLEDGTRVSAETSRRLCCDASVVRVEHAEDGRVHSVGRRTRTIPAAVRRALEIRDRGCCFPGCGRRFTDAHHVKHWADGGESSVTNCLLLCRHHHRMVHEGGWRVLMRECGSPSFIDPRGGEHFEGGWESPALGADSVSALLSQNISAGSNPDGWTACASWLWEG
jgi:hypothetical protein